MSGLFILNVGSGDTKITFDKSKPEEVEKARRVVQDMLKRGYAILVEAGQKDGKPIYYRATAFDPKTDEYIVAGAPEEEPTDPGHGAMTVQPEEPEQPKKSRKGKRIKAEGTKAVAVARSAGGMSMAADSIEMENMRKLDPFHSLRAGLAKIAEGKGEWAGIPMPLEHRSLVIEPSYPNALELMRITEEEPEGKSDEKEVKIRNTFFSHKLRCDVTIWEEDGKICWGINPAINHVKQEMFTMEASAVWGVEQEAAALQLLAQLLTHFQFKRYLMTGSFTEQSPRSQLVYFFRRLRPTIAVSLNRRSQDEYDTKIVAALCMHPIAYYNESWAGAMCPTDDVIAHLMLMRGDEHMFWKRSNQHHPIRPEAGL